MIDLLRFGVRHGVGDGLVIFTAGTLGGLISLLIPAATGLIFGSIIPSGDRSFLLQVALGLAAATLAKAAFEITRGVAVLRVDGNVASPLEEAVWDRLLNLPTNFFRDYTAGDLASRASGLHTIRQVLTGATLSSLLGALFSLFGIALMYYYDPTLAGLAVLLVLTIFAVTVAAGILQLRYQRDLLRLQGKISGTLFQLLTGIAKLRAAGAENSAFAVWAKEFTEQRRLTFRVERIGNHLAVFSATIPLVTGMVLFASIAARGLEEMPAAVFLAFNAAFGQVLAGVLSMNAVVTSLLSAIPMFERVKPILHAVPEVNADRKDPGELKGQIDVARVSFRYAADGPWVLDHVTIRAKPGEFVAIVGPSGSGKSTLLRLLLGFETPELGGVYYDSQDLEGLDLQSVRHQIGVVLQQARLMPGDIYKNIVGIAPLTLDDAWEAARMAGLDKEIQAMPMGMHTVISEGGGAFSGGQRQRLLIARAVAAKPRIVLFDEATSALDNETQEQVSRSLDQMQATRIVIAHRLSTIVNADQIYVMQAGRVVQSGTYDELIKEEGLFADLAKRQLA